jgi:Leucine-rich repeat (LRR) protein
MKTRLLTLILALSCFLTYAQTTSVPDANFENYLETHNASGIVVSVGDPSSMGDGTNGNGLVTTSKISGVTTLVVNSLGISDLTGIEDFIALEWLECRSNQISGTLDLTNNLSLEVLNCRLNMINSLLLPNTISLYSINCTNNQLTSLDISNNTDLQSLVCGNNQISSINLTNHPNLLFLSVNNNNLMNLDVSSNTSLIDLRCWENQISTLDISNLFNLQILYAGDNLLSGLNLDNNSQLDQLEIYSNNLTSLDASNCTNLTYFDCTNNPSLSSLTLPNTTTLVTLWACCNNLSSLDYANNTGLEYFDIGINNFTSADVSMLPNLIEFYCNQNQLTSLNLKNGANGSLDWMWAQDNSSLTCIQVDDVAQANAKANWSKDVGASYNTTCALGIEEFNTDEVSIFPNPTKDKINVNLRVDASYSLTNLFGQEVNKGAFVSGNNDLDIQSLSNGLYFLNIESPEGKATKKLIKE